MGLGKAQTDTTGLGENVTVALSRATNTTDPIGLGESVTVSLSMTLDTQDIVGLAEDAAPLIRVPYTPASDPSAAFTGGETTTTVSGAATAVLEPGPARATFRSKGSSAGFNGDTHTRWGTE